MWVLRIIFGPEGDEVTVEWRKLHNEGLNDLYSSHNIVRVIKSRRMRWAWHLARTGERRGVYRVYVGNLRERDQLDDRRSREDNIKMGLQEVGCSHMDWIELAQDSDMLRALVNAIMNLRVPENAGNFWTS